MAAVCAAGGTSRDLPSAFDPVGAPGRQRILPEQAQRQLVRTRIVAIVPNTGFVLWILAPFGVVDPDLRAPVALLVFMGCVGTAYCLGSFPPASLLTMIIAGPPIATV